MNKEELKKEILYEVRVTMHWDAPTCENWYLSKNTNFGDQSPLEMVESGSGASLLKYIKEIKK